MDDIDVEEVRKLISAQIVPALEFEVRRIEDNLAARASAFEQRIEMRVEQRHQETRVRLQGLQEGIGETKDRAEKNGATTMMLLGELREFMGEVRGRMTAENAYEGRREAAGERRRGWMKWALGAIAGSGFIKWAIGYFKHRG